MSQTRSSTDSVARRPAVLIPLIKRQLDGGAEHKTKSLAYYRDAGALLLEARQGIERGRWLEWLGQHFGLSAREAQRYMALAQNDTLSHLDGASTRRSARRSPRPVPPSDGHLGHAEDHERPTYRQPDARTATRRYLALEMLEAGFKKLAKERHPDVGGTDVEMGDLNDARTWATGLIENQPVLDSSSWVTRSGDAQVE